MTRTPGRIGDFHSTLLESDFGACVKMNGAYRVEIYADGHRLARKKVRPSSSVGAFQGAALRDPGVGLCYPSGGGAWKRVSSVDGTLAAGYRDPTQRRGANALAFFTRRRPSAAAIVAFENKLMKRAVNQTLYTLHQDRVESGGYTASALRCPDFWDDEKVAHLKYVSPAIALFVKSWTANDGVVHVGVAWHKRSPHTDSAEDNVSCVVLASMTAIDQNAVAAK